jgi:hypothetical protein
MQQLVKQFGLGGKPGRRGKRSMPNIGRLFG